jgi:hypothetical protein
MWELWWMEKMALGQDFLTILQCFHSDYRYNNATFSHLLFRVGTKDSFAATHVVPKDSVLPTPRIKNKRFDGRS